MNVLVADSRISTAALLSAELRSRDVSVTLAVPAKEGGSKPLPEQEKAFPSSLREVAWNPYSWLSSDSLLFEATKSSPLDALILLFDISALSPFFAELSPEKILLSSISAFQTLADAVLKKFHSQKAGRIVFMLSRRGGKSPLHEIKGMQRIAASCAEAAFERFAEETAFLLSQTEDNAIDAVLIKSEFDSDGFLPWAVDNMMEENQKPVRNSGRWLSRGGGIKSIFQRKT